LPFAATGGLGGDGVVDRASTGVGASGTLDASADARASVDECEAPHVQPGKSIATRQPV